MAPERAHSAHMRPAVPLEHTIAAATACMEEMEEAGGLPAAVQHATTQAVVDSAAAAAAAPAAGELAGGAAASKRDGGFGASPAKVAASVRVPWAAKPLSNPLSSGDQEGACPLDSPRKPALPSSCGLGKASSSCLAEKQLAGPSSSGLKSGSLAFSSLASKCSEITAVTAACPAGSQHWDLSFNVPQLEAGYRWGGSAGAGVRPAAPLPLHPASSTWLGRHICCIASPSLSRRVPPVPPAAPAGPGWRPTCSAATPA